MVWLVDRRPPKTDDEAAIVAALADGPLSLSALIDAATEQLIELELGRSGGATEVALWGYRLFPSALLSAILALDGDLLRLSRSDQLATERPPPGMHIPVG